MAPSAVKTSIQPHAQPFHMGSGNQIGSPGLQGKRLPSELSPSPPPPPYPQLHSKLEASLGLPGTLERETETETDREISFPVET